MTATRRLLRGVGWLTKAVLLAVALAALALLWWGQRHPGWLGVKRYTAQAQRIDESRLLVEWWDGRVMIAGYRYSWSGSLLSYGEEHASALGPGFHARVGSGRSSWIDRPSSSSWVPYRRAFDGWNTQALEEDWRSVTAPCWVIALAAGAWPITSTGLLVRRRVRRRQLDANGRCPVCGYDLRATPEKCPECGRTVAP